MMASFIILTCSLFYDSYMQNGEIVDMSELHRIFKGTKVVIMAWISLFFIFFTIIFVTKFAINSSFYLWLPLYILYVFLLLSVAAYYSQQEGLGFASVIIIMV